jgi:hypothetical protein
VYASPLYVDRVTMTVAAYAGRTFHVVYAASSNGFVYAVNASPASAPRTTARGTNPVDVGAILWRRQLAIPGGIADGGTPITSGGVLDGGIPFGIMGTPVIDLNATPPCLYVASADATVILGNSIYECSAPEPVGFPIQHT